MTSILGTEVRLMMPFADALERTVDALGVEHAERGGLVEVDELHPDSLDTEGGRCNGLEG